VRSETASHVHLLTSVAVAVAVAVTVTDTWELYCLNCVRLP
jgi:hypothetical protein